MGPFFIIIVGVIVCFLISKFVKGNNANLTQSSSSSYKDFDVSKRSSPHPNDTVLVKAEPQDQLLAIQKKLDMLAKIPKDSQTEKGKYLLFDTETTGLPRKRNAEPEDLTNWPYIVEIAWYLIDEEGLLVDGCHYIVRQNVSIPLAATEIHHISTQKMLREGVDAQKVYSEFVESAEKAEYIIAHNLEFDMPIIECELLRNGFDKILFAKKQFCTMKIGRNFCTVYDRAGKLKNPKLVELFGELYFNDPYMKIEGTHNALADANMLYRCFMKMKELRPDLLNSVDCINESIFRNISLEEAPLTVFGFDSDNIPMIPNNELLEYFSEDGFKQVQVLVTGVSKENKDKCWQMITALNGKPVKSVTKNLGVVVLGAVPGWRKLEDIRVKIQSGEHIVGITDIQLQFLYEQIK